ncbi:hypothetical protein GIB67_040280 [Kingdonia uniflora]|uniref:Reverse transcriptase zinc-binding domain-containing protein n=1 Tax=Kingdonia uniflora TaxID=39325 RepID=A0A7J7MV74_9MAGN|nr:hypothetical protein GIB67_040280 [Kingdonia uniflora]
MEVYQSSSSQWVNKQKCKNFAGSLSAYRLNTIVSFFGFGMGSLPERYLGIPMIQGRVSKATVAPLIDRIRSRATVGVDRCSPFRAELFLYNQFLQVFQSLIWLSASGRLQLLMKARESLEISCGQVIPQRRISLQSNGTQAKFLNKEGSPIQYIKKSSIWTGLKEAIVSVKANSKWIIGSGKDIDFWRDCWGSDVAITKILDINPDIWKHCKVKLSQIIHQNTWAAPPKIVDFLASLGIDLKNITLNNSDKDIRVWKHCSHGNFSVHSAYHHINFHRPEVWWFKYINSKAILPRIASFTWKVCNNVLATEDNLRKRGLNMASRCSLCRYNLETSDHLFCHYPVSIQTWDWMASLFCIQAGFSNLQNVAGLSGNSMANNYLELQIVTALGVSTKARPLPRIQSYTWALPWFQEVKINCGATAIGSPDKVGIGAVARKHNGEVFINESPGSASNSFGDLEMGYEGQVVVDFLAEFPVSDFDWEEHDPNLAKEAANELPPSKPFDDRASWISQTGWRLLTDGSVGPTGSGIRIVLITPSNDRIEKFICLDFKASNNVTECEALIYGLDMTLEIGVTKISA